MILFDDYEELMALTEVTRDTMEVHWDQCIYVVTENVVMRGVEAVTKEELDSAVYTPGTPLSEVPEKLRGLAEVLWTPEIIAEYQQRHAADEPVEEDAV